MKKFLCIVLIAALCTLCACGKKTERAPEAVTETGEILECSQYKITKEDGTVLLANGKDYVYTMLADGTVKILGYNGTDSKLYVPDTIDGKKVTVIGTNAYYDNNALSTVTIPEGVTEIGDYAFRYDLEIRRVSLPASLAKIGINPFASCAMLGEIALAEGNTAFQLVDGVLYTKDGGTLICCPMGLNLTEYDVPEGTRVLADESVGNNTALARVSIPASVEKIGMYAFSNCYALEEIVIPEGVKSLGADAFYYCVKLASVTLPAGLTEMAANPFTTCTKLKNVVISPENPVFTCENACVTDKNGRLVAYLNGREDSAAFTLPAGVTVIGNGACYGCSALTEIALPEGITAIEPNAFGFCRKLASVTLPATLTSVGSYAFANCSAMTAIRLPEGVKEIGSSAFMMCSALKSVNVPEGVSEIGNSTFYHCDKLTDVTLPASLRSIGEGAFYACAALTSLTLPEGVEKMSANCFMNCGKLTLRVKDGSYAEGFAVANGIPCETY